MNKPASKEPSMDEILSSIRQIIADDDAAVAPRTPAAPVASPAAAAAPTRPTPVPRPAPPISSVAPAPRVDALSSPSVKPADEPLALTPAQMLHEEPADEPASAPRLSVPDGDIHPTDQDDGKGLAASSQLVDPEDVTFDEPEPALPSRQPPPPIHAEGPRFASRVESSVAAPPRQSPSIARAAPMPDPTLSRDMAEQLLEPATNAAVKHTFSRLNGVSMAGSGVTLDALMREMLRPMLKEWLDENLPAVVERMVEKEIARISRGGD